MDKKAAKALLDELIPGWSADPSPAVYIKNKADPKVRMRCLDALYIHGPIEPDKLTKPKAKAKAKAKPKTTTPKAS
jgi:hypothetical protein